MLGTLTYGLPRVDSHYEAVNLLRFVNQGVWDDELSTDTTLWEAWRWVRDQCLPRDCAVLEFDEVRRPPGRAMGFPYDQFQPSRQRFVRSPEFPEECNRVWNCLLDESYMPVWRVMGKFELLKLSKIAEMKGRDIIFPPFPLTLCAGRLFQEQNDLLSAGYELRTPIMSGYTKYFGGHDRWYENHSRWEFHHEWDAVSWDAHFRPEFQKLICLMRLTRLAADAEDGVRVVNWYAHQSRSLCLMNCGAVVAVAGMKSGSFNTFADNSLADLVFNRHLLLRNGVNGYITVGGDDVAVSTDGPLEPDPEAARFGLEYGPDRVSHPKLDDLSMFSTKTVWSEGRPRPCTVRPDKLLAAVHYVPHSLDQEARRQRLMALAIEGWYSSAGPILRQICSLEQVDPCPLAAQLFGPMPAEPGLAQKLLSSFRDGEVDPGSKEAAACPYAPGPQAWPPSWGL